MNKGTVAYDKEHDVLHIRYAPITYTEDSMEKPGIIVKRETKHGRINSIVILDFSRREAKSMASICKGVDLIEIRKKFIL